MARKRKLKIILIFLVFALIVVTSIDMSVGHFYGKMNIVKNSTDKAYDKKHIDEILAKKEEEEESSENKEEEIMALVKRNAEPLENEDSVLNILLIGTDQRGDLEGTRSDTVMVASINDDTQEITLSSFMRDSYVKIPGYGDAKLNAAYAYGGSDLLKETLYNNFNIPVEKFVQVDFDTFIKAFDVVGDIDVTINEYEMKAMNECIDEINALEKRPWGTNNIPTYGDITLKNGEQALAYARIRKVGNSDFDRTNRQRELLEKAFEKVKAMNIIELNNLANEVLPLITTNLTKGECFSLILNLNKYKTYELNQLRFPVDNSFKSAWKRKQQVLLIDFDKNIDVIKNDIYKEIAD